MNESRKKGYRLFGKVIAIIFIIVTFVAFVSSLGIHHVESITLDNDITTDIIDGSGKITHYDGRTFLPPKRGDTVVFHIKLPDDLDDNSVLCFSNYNSVVTVEYGNRILYSHGEEQWKKGFQTGHTLIRATLPDGAHGSIVIRTLQLESNTTSQIPNVKIMPAEVSWLYPVSSSWKQFQFILFSIFIIVAFFTLIFYTVTLFRDIDSRQGVAVSLFCISLTFWAMGFTSTIFVISDSSVVVPFLEYICLYLTPAFFAAYMAFGKKDGSRGKKLFLVMTSLYTLLFAIATFWQFFIPGHAGYTSLLTTCHIGLFVGAGIAIVSIFKDKGDDSRLMRIGMVLTLLVSLLEVGRVFLLRSGLSARLGMTDFTSQTLTPYIVMAFELTVMIDYAFKVYYSYKNRIESDKLEAIAYTDGLTGLNNRTAFDVKERKTLRSDDRYTLAFIDADGLKAANDLFGHETGDELLRIVGEAILSGAERYMCRCYRYGGDEFILVSEDSRSLGNAVSMMRNILKAHDNSEMPFEITASVGIVIHKKGDGDTIDDVIRKADKKMYEAKVENKRTRENVVDEIERRMKSAAGNEN